MKKERIRGEKRDGEKERKREQRERENKREKKKEKREKKRKLLIHMLRQFVFFGGAWRVLQG